MGDLMMAQSRFRSKVLWSVLSLMFILWGAHYVYHSKTLGFSISRITSDFSHHPEWEVAPLPDEERKRLDGIFSQPFRYLGAGSQSCAFASADGKYVLKFFRMKHKTFYIKDLWVGNRSQERLENLFSIYASHKLAYEKMREDAGLIYLHLNKTSHLNKKIKLIDRLHRSHYVNLDEVEFVVQERAELIFDRLQKLIHARKGVNGPLTEVMHLVRRRIDKGIADHDKAVAHNFGFVGDRAIQLDVGRIYEGHKPNDYDRILERIDKWLDGHNTSR